MSKEFVLAAVISAIPALAAALLSFIGMLITRHTRKVAQEAKEQVKALHIEINSRFTELLRLTAEVAHAKGIAEGQATERNRSTLQVEVTGSMLKEKPPDAA